MDKLREDAAAVGGDHSMDLLEGFFSDMGLEVYTHNFTLNFPFGKGKKFQGKNLYAILRAPRASSTESLVLSAPFRRSLSLEPPTDVSLALLLASAKFFRTQVGQVHIKDFFVLKLAFSLCKWIVLFYH